MRRLKRLAMAIAAALVAGSPLTQPPPAPGGHEPAPGAPSAGVAAAAPETFLATFDGSPGSPQPFRPQDWDTTVFALVGAQRVSPMTAAHHGTDCGPHPSYHALSGAPEEYIFVCRDHLMTALADDGHVLVTPPSLLDFSAGESVLRWDMSTLRTSSRDWINVWLAPFEGNFQLAGRFGQAPADAINVTLGHTTSNPSLVVSVIRGGASRQVGNPDAAPRLRDVLPGFSATRRDTFELRVSRTRLRLSLPQYNVVLVDETIDALGWDKGVVSFGQQGYTPGKDCPPELAGELCGPGTWHWDNLSMSPAAPFTIRRTDRRVYDAGAPVVALPVPAPEGARLRFWGPGMGVEASVDGGRTWTAAPIPRSDGAADHAQAYWLPLPAGTTRVLLRGPDRWAAADVTVWSR